MPLFNKNIDKFAPKKEPITRSRKDILFSMIIGLASIGLLYFIEPRLYNGARIVDESGTRAAFCFVSLFLLPGTLIAVNIFSWFTDQVVTLLRDEIQSEFVTVTYWLKKHFVHRIGNLFRKRFKQ